MQKYYSETIYSLIEQYKHNLIIPDLVLIKEGVSCGDRLIIRGQVDDGVLRFDIVADDACLLCKAASIDVTKRYSNMGMEEIKIVLLKEYKSYESNQGIIFERFGLDESQFANRFECLISPFKLLLNFIKQLQGKVYTFGYKPNTIDSMECDACVSACSINWENKIKQKIDHRGDKKYGKEYLKKWLPLGKIELLEEDVDLLKRMCGSITDSDFQFLSDYTMNSFVLNHLMNYAPELVDERWKPAAYLIQKNEVNKWYFEEIKEYVSKNKIEVYFIKGYVSQKYYENPALRIHSDYDVIAVSCLDAFKLANYLMNNGFSIRPNLFSYKPIVQNGETVISGHFHLQRIIDDTYMFELDISFPGFPLNRINLYYPRLNGNDISIEDQVIITLLHLFKHSNVYMKDINDLFYMLQEDMNYIYLSERLNKCELKMYFQIATDFILNNYPSAKEKLKRIVDYFGCITEKKYMGWPYDEEVHKRIKLDDYLHRMEKGEECERQYLYPVAIFKDIYEFDGVDRIESDGFEIKMIDEGIYMVSYNEHSLYLTSIGILINSYLETKNITRLEYVEIIKNVMNCIGISNSMTHEVPFATEHFYVRSI